MEASRDARPGDVMGVLRSLAVEALSVPRFLGEWVGNAGKTWPLLLGIPILPPYYSLRILPYVVPQISTWKRRMLRERDLTDALA